MRPALWHVLPCSAMTTLVVHGIPWWATSIVVSLGPVAYICRICLHYKLANKALDKAPITQTAEVMTAITGKTSTKTAR